MKEQETQESHIESGAIVGDIHLDGKRIIHWFEYNKNIHVYCSKEIEKLETHAPITLKAQDVYCLVSDGPCDIRKAKVRETVFTAPCCIKITMHGNAVVENTGTVIEKEE